ncbi:MAG: ABC transporter ATP-binding protein [Candidatus Rokuibacteriota bacterium]|nr:MAG: ABC transporter ATP-binding protein [Candidatus Rokubacteria bacterium]
MLEAVGLNSWYGDIQVLWDITLAVGAGEIVAVVGANAAGKSTLLLSVSGMLPRVGGRLTGAIRFDGRNVSGLAAHSLVARGLVQVMEGRRLFPYLTVEENLELGAYNRSARERYRQSLEEVFALLPVLKDRRRQLAGSLSGGEQQMCAIGRALVARPKMLLLDEPTIGLAPRYVERTFEIVRAINARGTSILLVEQNVRHSLGLAQRGYVLESGRIALSGSGKDLLANEGLRKAYLGL